jgi:pilus assembly protein CpaE
VKQALWTLAAEVGLVKAPETPRKGGRFRGDRGSVTFWGRGGGERGESRGATRRSPE